MSKLSAASVELARTRPRAHDSPAQLPGYNVHPPCHRCRRQCDFCLDYMADHAAAYADELHPLNDD